MIKKILIVFGYSIYLFILLGFILHTSEHPVFLGKYTLKNLFAITILLIGFIPYIFLLIFLLSPSALMVKKRKMLIVPWQKVILFCLTIIVLILPVEFYMRQKYATYSKNDYLYTVKNFHPFLQLQLDSSSPLHINKYGFRGEEITKTKPPHTFRIFVLGGSTVLNSGVAYDKTLTYLLEKKLQKQYPDRKIEVLNAGVDGYTSEHSLIQYLFSIQDFSPDLVIMWHGINDWYYSCSPSYMSISPFKADYSHIWGTAAPMVEEHFSPSPLLSIHLVSFDKVEKFLQDNLYSDIMSSLEKRLPRKGIYEGDNNKKTVEKKNFPSLMSYKRNLTNFIKTLKQQNVPLLLGNQPYLYSTHMTKEEGRAIFFPSNLCSVNGKYPSLTSVINSLEDFNKTAATVAEENEIPFIDLASIVPKNLTYFTDDVHYTESGNTIIADGLFKKVLEGGLISE